ncbi:RNA-binding protein, partial [Escherichia coli]|nr:RNA-binding protein [Escherichia coli]
ILGTLMSLGMKRDIFGDILNNGTEWQLLVESTMKDYLTLQLEKIGKVNVMLEETDLANAVYAPVVWEE